MEKLTNLEEMIMKCIWDYGEEIPFLQIGKELKERYGKDAVYINAVYFDKSIRP